MLGMLGEGFLKEVGEPMGPTRLRLGQVRDLRLGLIQSLSGFGDGLDGREGQVFEVSETRQTGWWFRCS